MSKSYAEFIYPDSSNCPKSVAEAVLDIRDHKADEKISKTLTDRYGSVEYFILAAEYVYEANDWSFTPLEKKMLRSAFRGPNPPKRLPKDPHRRITK
jgi:hypothetical protein